jgi:hypothetical protein
MDALDQFDDDSYLAAAGTFASYGLILAVMTAVLFGVPYAIFLAL